jgi:predicted nucleic acid-binding protein
MTKVELNFALARPLDAGLLRNIVRARTLYGIARIAPAQSLDALEVEYDASRLTEADVEAALRRAGIPAELRAPGAAQV